MTLPQVNKNMFQPRPEALQYFQRQKGEKALIQYIEESFQFDEGDISAPIIETDADDELNEIFS